MLVVLLDAPSLLRTARRRSGLSQAELAGRASVSQAALSRYERGLLSPPATTLVRILAAAGLQARCVLEPLLADLDERVDAFMTATPALDVDRVASAAASFAQSPSGPVTWALDGHSALACFGLGPGADGLECLALLFDQAARHWMFRQLVQGRGAPRSAGWFDITCEAANAHLGTITTSRVGMFRLRVVDELPAHVLVQPAGADAPLPVLTVDAVAQGNPELAELLARWRRRSDGGRTVVR